MNFFKGLFNGFLISTVLWGIVIFLVITLSSCTNTSEYVVLKTDEGNIKYIPSDKELWFMDHTGELGFLEEPYVE